jgi:cysteine synthase A
MSEPVSSVLDLIGKTPVVRLHRLAPGDVEVFVKLEAQNPGGSVKDRIALGIIEAAERDGSLKPGQTVVEATSGNTGIGLALVCARKGYPLVVTMAESFSVERRKLMRFLGAHVVLTPASEKGTGMIEKARELAEKHGWFLARQFENEAGPDFHSATTAQEILDDFPNETLDHWVTGFGTGGTLHGVARVLREKSPGTRIHCVEPENSVILASDWVQKRHHDGSPADSAPNWRPHPMQGWSPDFIPKIAEDAKNGGMIDDFDTISGAAAMDASRRLAREEGIFTGISGGATLASALELAARSKPGTKILAMLPDTGERYLSTPLFEDISETMNAEEEEIAASTPRFRIGVPASKQDAEPQQDEAPLEVPENSMAEVERLVASAPVVMFALKWCEFTWSVRNLFSEADIDYMPVELDGNDWREAAPGIRKALHKITGAKTIPQVFVGGKPIGGATEAMDAFNDGSLQAMLADIGHEVGQTQIENAYSFLPKWLHPR